MYDDVRCPEMFDMIFEMFGWINILTNKFMYYAVECPEMLDMSG
jgi:hypothetical protein